VALVYCVFVSFKVDVLKTGVELVAQVVDVFLCATQFVVVFQLVKVFFKVLKVVEVAAT
jgi:hypothetical protein